MVLPNRFVESERPSGPLGHWTPRWAMQIENASGDWRPASASGEVCRSRSERDTGVNTSRKSPHVQQYDHT